jgi:hypothetical protein
MSVHVSYGFGKKTSDRFDSLSGWLFALYDHKRIHLPLFRVECKYIGYVNTSTQPTGSPYQRLTCLRKTDCPSNVASLVVKETAVVQG